MPDVDGVQLIQFMQQDPGLQLIPVIGTSTVPVNGYAMSPNLGLPCTLSMWPCLSQVVCADGICPLPSRSCSPLVS